ncbi:MAG: hypothetical protein HY699_18995 [Deltaproteobacteria bacterium]|nr:hypothetical protein [Deltaproteobacteria bacterium]
MKRLRALPLLALVLSAACDDIPSLFPAPTPTPVGAVIPREPLSTSKPDLPGLAERAARFKAALSQNPPILLLADLAAAPALAQRLAIGDPRFLANVSEQGQPLRNEIFGVYPVRKSDLTEATMPCATSPCFRVELYNYARNLTTVAMVDVGSRLVLAVHTLPETQPDVPPHLERLAIEIATKAPDVMEALEAALGAKPEASMAMMGNTKTALNGTRCQRSRHLCVAPTFIAGTRALWTIVDLTDGVLVGTQWTNLGETSGHAVTERSLQNDVVTAKYCEKATPFAHGGWALDYILTSSDGMRISNVRHNGKKVLESAKLVDWHVSYSSTLGFGYSDAIGCPMFSQAAVVAFQGPTVADLRSNGTVVGFALVQKFWSHLWPTPCNYYYVQRFEFYDDGRFRIVGGNIGRGCGDQGTYRPVTRIALAGKYTAAAWNGAAWQDWSTEQWQLQADGAYTAAGYQYRLRAENGGGFYLEPGQGQFGDGGRGDNAYLYVTRYHRDKDEGDSDMVTIGPCCNEDYQQGPEKFIDTPPEDIAASEMVLWYVPQIKIDSTPGREYCWADSTLVDGVYVANEYPCYTGPMFVPIAEH